jgi:hypothetical protein
MSGYRGVYGQIDAVGTELPRWLPPPPPQATSLVTLRAQAQTAAQGTLPPAGWSNYIFAVVWKGYPTALAFNYDDVNEAQDALFEAFDLDPYGPSADPPAYAAVFDATSPKWPLPINEATGPGIHPALAPWGKQLRPSTWRLREGVAQGVVVKRPVHPRVIKEAVRGQPHPWIGAVDPDTRRNASTIAARLHKATERYDSAHIGVAITVYGVQKIIFDGGAYQAALWLQKQAGDPNTWYAATFDLSRASTPTQEISNTDRPAVSGVFGQTTSAGEQLKESVRREGLALLMELREQITQFAPQNQLIVRPSVSAAVRTWWLSTVAPLFGYFVDWIKRGSVENAFPWATRLAQLRRESAQLGLLVIPSAFFDVLDAEEHRR